MAPRSSAVTLTVIAVVLVAAVSVVPVVNASGTTDVSLVPSEKSLSPGETTTFEVVLESASGGVGSVDMSVSTNDTAVATITDVSLNDGFPSSFTSVNVSNDGSSATFSTAAGDTNDTGQVIVATITVEGQGYGTANLDLQVTTAGDESGSTYDINTVSDATVSASRPTVSVSLSPTDASTVNGGKRKIDIVAENATAGVGSFDLNISVANTSVATISTVAFAADGLTNSTISDGGASAQLSASTLDISGGNQVTIATVTLQSQVVGETDISLTVETIGDTTGTTYELGQVSGGTLHVSPRPDPIDDEFESPNDTDGDGTLEDTNGDGQVNVNDLTAIWTNRKENPIQKNGKFFDFNGDGTFDINDITALWNQIRND